MQQARSGTAAIAVLACFLLCGCVSDSTAPPQASDGVLDLRAWDFARNGAVPLSGNWAFYWQQLLEPHEAGETVIAASEVWDDLTPTGDSSLGARGYGTYRLRVLLPEHALGGPLAVRLRGVMTSHRLWLGDQEFEGAGRVSANLEEVLPATPNRVHVIPDVGEELLINLQVANDQFRMGGMRKSLQLGTVDDVLDLQTDQILYDTVIFTLLIAAGTYFLLIYAVRTVESYRLFFGLLCVLTAVRTTVAGEALLVDLFIDELPWATHIIVEYGINYLGCALVPLMVGTLYWDKAIKPWMYFICGAATLMVLFVFVAPVEWVVRSGNLFDFLFANAAAFVILVLWRASRAKLEHASPFLFTICLFAVGIVIDILRSNGVIYSPVELGPALFTALLLVQTIILGRSFNRTFTANEKLTAELQVANEDLKLTNLAVQRFVPYEFLSLLHRKSIREVRRGDSAALELEVLFCDMRNFTTIVEQLPAHKAFALINDWLEHLEPVVSQHQGFTNQYFGDGVMALFAGGADRAVLAGIDILRANEAFNASQTHVADKSIRIGIGLNSGPIMLGTIGGQHRLENGVVGDAVNVASRVESMTKLYGTPFLLTDLTHARLENPQAFSLRLLDTVSAKGRSKPLTIFEVLDGLPEPVRGTREANLVRFAEGLECYRAGEFSDAERLFSDCLRLDQEDQTADLYVQRCRRMTLDPPKDWDGVSVLLEK